MALILNQAQAQATLIAHEAVRGAGGLMDLNFGTTKVYVRFAEQITVMGYASPTEQYPNRAAFAAAYGLS